MSSQEIAQGTQAADKPTEQLVALRANQIAGPKGILPIGLTTWWQGVRTGKYPQPTKLGPRCTVWRRDQIMALLDTTS
jgi:prophage regulatory protein